MKRFLRALLSSFRARPAWADTPVAQRATIPEHQNDPAAHPHALKTIAASGTAQTLDLGAFDVFDITLTGNLTLAFTNLPQVGDVHAIVVRLKQDGTGSRTVTWPASVKWAGGAAPTITVTATTGRDIVTLRTFDGGVTWNAIVSQAFA